MAAGPVVQVGQNNTYIKDHASSGKMIIDFSRNKEDFALNNYIQMRRVKKQTGYYLQIDQLQAGRLQSGRTDDYVWPDGHPRPEQNAEGAEYNFKDYATIRRNIGHMMGDLAVDQADWDIEGTQERLQAQKAMTLRTQLVRNALNTETNWDASHWDTVTNAGGGLWGSALSTNAYIKKSLNYATNLILKDTMGVVRRKDLVLVMGPELATTISETQEIIDHIKQSPDAYSQLEQGASRWTEFGLPNRLYGIPVFVDVTVSVTSNRNAASVVKNFIYGENEAYLISRPGGLVSKAGGPSFSTITAFVMEEMTVEKERDAYNRRRKINIVDNIGIGMTAPVAGFAFRNVLS